MQREQHNLSHMACKSDQWCEVFMLSVSEARPFANNITYTNNLFLVVFIEKHKNGYIYSQISTLKKGSCLFERELIFEEKKSLSKKMKPEGLQ